MAAGPPGGKSRRWTRSPGDLAALGVLALVPLALVALPAAAGHLWLPGDDLTQNFPLRHLVGLDLRHGHLPLWDPYIWDGTPLLGGWNAGAFYPATLLFAVLPGAAAWAVGQTLTLVLAGWGMYAFLRAQRLGPLAAWLGALVFAWSGFMVAHTAHIGLLEGTSWLGWILLVVDRLSGEPARPWRWVAALGVLGGLVGLAGEPRAISNVAVVGGVYALWLLVSGRHRARLGGRLVGAAVIAGLIGCAQLLPGLAAVAGSQRAHLAYGDWGAGSLSLPQLLLLAVPFADGGFASLGLPPYAGAFNVTELTGYAGLLTLSGGLAALTVGRRAGRPRHGTAVWAVIGALGVVLALGASTPAGHLLARVPLYGGERLQNRNLGVVTAALAVLFAACSEHFVAGGRGAWGDRRTRRWARALALVAPVAVGGLTVAAVVAPGSVQGALAGQYRLLPRDWPFFIASLVVAGAVVGLVAGGRRLGLAGRRAAVVAVSMADLGFFLANAAVGWTAPAVVHPGPGSPAAALASMLGGRRYAVFDPGLFYRPYRQAEAGDAPVPDLNLLAGIGSVQGYGSLVAGGYQQATGTHAAGLIDLPMLSTPLADQLGLRLLLTEPSYLTGPGAGPLAGLDGRWQRVGTLAGLVVLANRHPLTPGWLQVAGRPIADGRVRVVTEPWGDTKVQVDAPGPARLVVSEAWASGWQARVDTGRPGPWRAVGQAGLFQSTPVPAGPSTVELRYRPRRVTEGLAAGAAGVIIAGLAALVGPARRRRATPPT